MVDLKVGWRVQNDAVHTNLLLCRPWGIVDRVALVEVPLL